MIASGGKPNYIFPNHFLILFSFIKLSALLFEKSRRTISIFYKL